jgi:hypothetical protein
MGAEPLHVRRAHQVVERSQQGEPGDGHDDQEPGKSQAVGV